MAITWDEVLKEDLVGRQVVTCEMGVYFRGTIDRVEQDGNNVTIHPKSWSRSWPNGWHRWKTQQEEETGHPEPLRFLKTGDLACPPHVDRSGDIVFAIPFKGEITIKHRPIPRQK